MRMILESGSLSHVPNPEEIAARHSFRRGRILVLTVVLITAGYLFQSSVRELWLHGFHDVTSDQVVGWFVLGALCWYALHGGKFAIGCFSMMYGMILMVFVTVAAFFVASRVSPANPSPEFDLGFWTAAFVFLQVVWAVFALWVVLISRDARLYMRMRREGIAESEVNAFEWPPANRRQE